MRRDDDDGLLRGQPQRKQQAIRVVGQLATDAAGNPCPVRQHHRLRAGLGRGAVRQLHRAVQRQSRRRRLPDPLPVRRLRLSYRPDPSYLPASLQQHIAGLRADRETARAMDAADYVLASLTAEIDVFTAVAEAMHRKLSQMDPAQRTEIEGASRILRRARAGRTLPLIPSAAPACCPALKIPDLAGVHDADEEPGISGGVVGKVPVHMGEVPDSRQILGGDCCLRAGAGRERRGRLSLPGHGQQPAAGQHVDPRPPAGVLQPVAAAEDQRRGRQVLQRGAQLAVQAQDSSSSWPDARTARMPVTRSCTADRRARGFQRPRCRPGRPGHGRWAGVRARGRRRPGPARSGGRRRRGAAAARRPAPRGWRRSRCTARGPGGWSAACRRCRGRCAGGRAPTAAAAGRSPGSPASGGPARSWPPSCRRPRSSSIPPGSARPSHPHQGAAGVAACHPAAARATRDGPLARYRHLADAGTCRPRAGPQVTDTPDRSSARCRRQRTRLVGGRHRRARCRYSLPPWES